MKVLKHIAMIIVFLSLIDCGGSGGGSAGISGLDLSGQYSNGRVICTQSVSPYNTTKTAFIEGTSYFTITGNNVNSHRSSLGASCVVITDYKIVFADESNYEVSNINVTDATGGGCTLATTISGQTGSGGAITGLPSTTFVKGADSSTLNNSYSYKNNELYLYLPTTTTSGSSPADFCFLLYDKS